MAEASRASQGTVAKALHVLDMIAEAGRPLRFVELLEQSPYPKATLYRLLQTLTREGMLHFDARQQAYFPGMRLLRQAHAAWAQATLAPIAAPSLDRLSQTLEATVHLAQLDNAQVLYIDKRHARAAVNMFSAPGKVGPAYCTGVGKVLLAWLDEVTLSQVLARQSFHAYTDATLTDAVRLRQELQQIRRDGFALDREEHEVGIICIAVPVLLGQRALAALSVTSTVVEHSLKDLSDFLPGLQKCAEEIARDAQPWQFPGANRIDRGE